MRLPRGPALAALAALALACAAGPARANRIAVLSCHGPSGEAIGHDGWINERTGDAGMVALDSCASGAAGAMSLDLAGNSNGYPDQAREEWTFYAPPWGSILSYRLAIADSATTPYQGAGVGQAFVSASDEGDPIYDYRNIGSGPLGASVIERTPPAPDRWLLLNASCDGLLGRCPANVLVSRLDVGETRVTLDDPTTPVVSSLGGTLLAAGPLRGTVALNIAAADEGPGVYSAQLSIDGTPGTPVIFDANGGRCHSLGPSGDAPRSFAHPDPCPQHASTTLTLDTSALPDGTHVVSLRVDDASGNAIVPLETTVQTDNAPQSVAAPEIAPGGAEVGARLSANPGSWSAPAGAGPIVYGYAWLACDAAGQGCSPIPGASGPSFTPSEAQAAHTLRVQVTAGDRDGSTSARSEASAQVSGAIGIPNGLGASDGARIVLDGRATLNRSYARSALSLSGRLLAPTGAPIDGAQIDVLSAGAGQAAGVVAHALTGADGAFTAHVPRGASRTLTLAYRSFSLEPGYTASVRVSETVRAGVLLAASPGRTSPHGRVTFSGRVLGLPAGAGAIVELLVRYRGSWQPIRTPRTGPGGRFRIAYVFQGAYGSFPFQVRVPGGQAALPYTAGSSRIVTVWAG